MYPMDYEEFLWVLGDSATAPLLHDLVGRCKSVGEQLNRRLMRDFRLYIFVGGMAKAVNEYIESNNFRKVDMVKRGIQKLYDDDFRKMDPTGRLPMLFDAIPSELNKNSSRYQVSSILTNRRTEQILELLAELKDSKTVIMSYHANDQMSVCRIPSDVMRLALYS